MEESIYPQEQHKELEDTFVSDYFKDNIFRNYQEQFIIFYCCREHNDVAYFVSDDLETDPMSYPDINAYYCLENLSCYYFVVGYALFGKIPGKVIAEYIDMKSINKYWECVNNDYISATCDFEETPDGLEKFKSQNLLIKSASKLN